MPGGMRQRAGIGSGTSDTWAWIEALCHGTPTVHAHSCRQSCQSTKQTGRGGEEEEEDDDDEAVVSSMMPATVRAFGPHQLICGSLNIAHLMWWMEANDTDGCRGRLIARLGSLQCRVFAPSICRADGTTQRASVRRGAIGLACIQLHDARLGGRARASVAHLMAIPCHPMPSHAIASACLPARNPPLVGLQGEWAESRGD